MSKDLDIILKKLVNLHPKYIDLSLIRLRKLLDKLNNPHLKIPPVIHIAGTNGKGSTLSFIRYILMENNYKVHAYVSPHLKFFNERITISNTIIQNDHLLKTLKFVKKVNGKLPITFFEITTAAALYLFSKHRADFLILETGLGGRLDATNVIKKSLIDIITPIGIDHQEFLGKDILKITNEKLGILKKDSSIIISKQKKLILTHIKKRLQKFKNEKLIFNINFKILNENKKNFTIKYGNKKIKFTKPLLIGDHQLENLSTALAAVLKISELGYKLSNKNINSGILKTKWPGRLERGKLGNINIYLDGAHNIDGAKQLSTYFKKKKIKVWLIIGMLNNKDIYNFLKEIKSILIGVISISIPGEQNSFTTSEIEKVCNKLKLENISQVSIQKANQYLLHKIKPKEVLITGSLYLIGRVRDKYL